MEKFLSATSILPIDYISLICSILSGFIIGFERQLLGKPAGIKTSTLICLSTFVFVAISKEMGSDYLRVVGQIITGVGFLGGGVILSREGIIQGMTSAAVIWALSAIGVVIGLGFPFVGLKIAILILLILHILDFFERRISFLQRGVHRVKRFQKKDKGE